MAFGLLGKNLGPMGALGSLLDTALALALGGEDTDANCGPAHEQCRRIQDKTDVASIAKAKRAKARHYGIKKPTTFRKPPPGYGYSWQHRCYIKLEKRT
mgnify:CR=1 FL=1